MQRMMCCSRRQVTVPLTGAHQTLLLLLITTREITSDTLSVSVQSMVTEVPLDGPHRTLLLLLLQDHARVLQAASGVAAEVAASDIFSLTPIKAAVQVLSCFTSAAGGTSSQQS